MIFLLTGPVRSGKTTLVKNTLSAVKESSFRISGYLSPAIWKGEDFLGYDLLDLRDNRTYPFIRKRGEEKWEKIGRFYFLPKTLDLAEKIILKARRADITVVDEVGPLELSGGGVWSALKKVLAEPELKFLLVVRSSILSRFQSRIESEKIKIFHVKQATTQEKIIKSLELILRKR
jgi:nucleoside-triphosphatase THEP1